MLDATGEPPDRLELLRVTQLLLRGRERLLRAELGLATLRDVHRDADEVRRRAGLRQQRDLARVQPPTPRRRVDRLLGDVEHRAAGEHLAILRDEELGLIRREKVVIRLADEPLARHAEQLLTRTIILHRGTILLDTTPLELFRQGKGDIHLAFRVLTTNRAGE